MHGERPYFTQYSNPSIFSLQIFGFANPASVTTNTDVMGLLYKNTLDDLATGQPQLTISTEDERVYIVNDLGQDVLGATITDRFVMLKVDTAKETIAHEIYHYISLIDIYSPENTENNDFFSQDHLSSSSGDTIFSEVNQFARARDWGNGYYRPKMLLDFVVKNNMMYGYNDSNGYKLTAGRMNGYMTDDNITYYYSISPVGLGCIDFNLAKLK